MTSDTAAFRIPRSWFWSAAFFAALIGMVVDANLDLLDPPWRWTLKGLVVILALAMMVAGYRQADADGPMSPAYRNLCMRMLPAVGFAIVVFSASAAVYRGMPLGTWGLWLLALATAIPMLILIWILGRYLTEETDEYLRHLATTSALIGLAAVLVLATVWGFLESLGLVPHIPSWYVGPLLAVAYGLGRAWLRTRGR